MNTEKNKEVIGYVGQITPKQIIGWAKPANSNDPIEVSLFVGTELIAKKMATSHRKDLKNSGIHPTGECGYKFDINETYDEKYLLENVKVYAGINELERTPALLKKSIAPDAEYYFFMHIPKTAGTSFRYMLYDQIEQAAIFPSVLDIKINGGRYPQLKQFKQRPMREQLTTQLIAGHYAYSANTLLPNSRCLVFLRNANSRAISNIFHLQKHAHEFQGKPFEQIFEEAPRHLDNLQVRYLSNTTANAQITKADLDKAKANLEKCYFIGITEQFAESIEALEKITPWNFDKNLKRNINNTKDLSKLPLEILRKLKACNHFDAELYEYGVKLFNKMAQDPKTYVSNLLDQKKQANKPNNKKKQANKANNNTQKQQITKANNKQQQSKPAPKQASQQQKQAIQKKAKPNKNINQALPALESLERSYSFIRFAINYLNGNPQKLEEPIPIEGSELSIRGWAVDSINKQLAAGVYLSIDGQTHIETRYGIPKPKIAERFKLKQYLKCGFALSIPVEKIGKGVHSIGIKVVSADKKNYYYPSKRILVDVK